MFAIDLFCSWHVILYWLYSVDWVTKIQSRYKEGMQVLNSFINNLKSIDLDFHYSEPCINIENDVVDVTKLKLC